MNPEDRSGVERQYRIVMGVEMNRHADDCNVRKPGDVRKPAVAPSEFDALLTSAFAPGEACRVDELLDWIEDYDAGSRFVPDWEGESFKNAA